MPTTTDRDLDSTASVLAGLRSSKAAEDAEAVWQMVLAVEYAAFNSVDSIDDASTLPGTEGEVALAGEGAPLVAEFAVTEFAAALGRSLDSARLYLGECLELAHRLPKVWVRVRAGKVAGWQARRIAAATKSLPPDGAAWVDGQVAPVAGRIGPTQLEKVVAEAVRRFDPERAAEEAYEALESRHVNVFVRDQHAAHGGAAALGEVHGVLDAADAVELDGMLSQIAGHLAALGSTAPLAVRRALALGSLARAEWVLDLPTEEGGAESSPGLDSLADARGSTSEQHEDRWSSPEDEDRWSSPDGDPRWSSPDGDVRWSSPASASESVSRPPQPTRRPARRPREVTLHVRLSEDALRGCGDGIATWTTATGRVLGQVTVEQVQAWCGTDNAHIVVRPVLDLDERITSQGYQPSERLRAQTTALHPRCVFPWCTRPSGTTDLDHIEPWAPDDAGGATASDQLAPLCRAHHRAKTHAGWTYTRLAAAEYLWRSPQGYRFHTGPDGTTDLDTPDPPDPPGRDTSRP